MQSLEKQARLAWRAWAQGEIRHGKCDACKEFKVVGRRYKRWLCLTCWDGGAK